MKFQLVIDAGWYSLHIYDERGKIFERLESFTSEAGFAEEIRARRARQYKECSTLFKGDSIWI